MFSGPVDLELVSINFPNTKVALALFYRPPSSSVSILDNLLSALYTSIDISKSSNFILLGDFNVKQSVTEPTHFCNSSCSLI